jgi:SAM-dependent methyltransferase
MPVQCRLCGGPLDHLFADLGTTPLANGFLKPADLDEPESYYPLRARVCDSCYLVQLDAPVPAARIFEHYPYFSSYSDTLLATSRSFVDDVAARLRLGPGDMVVEVASNDGYLLQYFLGRGLEVLGIEPARNIAAVAAAKGIPTLPLFFGREVAREVVVEKGHASLIVANNVLAHVPDLNDFLAGLRLLLRPRGLITLEFHHLLRLLACRQFDTIYHEHFQYFSLTTATRALEAHGLRIVDVEEIPAQGGSLRVYAQHGEDEGGPGPRVSAMLAAEQAAGLATLAPYLGFRQQITALKLQLLGFLVEANQAGRRVVAYGAAAKGNTLLNCCGIRADLVEYAVDRSPHKQGLFLPGSRIPIYHPDRVFSTKPDYLLILPWNLRDEIVAQMADIRDWGGRFVVAIPRLDIVS